MCKNERYTREIQRLREENAELKELYATYRERCELMSVLVNSTETYFENATNESIANFDNTETIAYNGDIDKGVQGGDTNGK